jgi:hypothetical protein
VLCRGRDIDPAALKENGEMGNRGAGCRVGWSHPLIPCALHHLECGAIYLHHTGICVSRQVPFPILISSQKTGPDLSTLGITLGHPLRWDSICNCVISAKVLAMCAFEKVSEHCGLLVFRGHCFGASLACCPASSDPEGGLPWALQVP